MRGWTLDYSLCMNCSDVTHRGELNDDDLCPRCVEFDTEGNLE